MGEIMSNAQLKTEPKTVDEYNQLSEIAKRGFKVINQANANVKYFDLFMDIEFTHQVNPLRLADLLAADDVDFQHDIVGIYLNFNRVTKQLDNCFSPRYSK
jgi:hypothetical protein